MIPFDVLKALGWAEKSGIMVRFSTPRIGYKPDGTLIIGYFEYNEGKVETLEELLTILERIKDEIDDSGREKVEG